MKFQPVIPKIPWSKEKTEARMDLVIGDIADFNRYINNLDRQSNQLKEFRRVVREKLKNKWRYYRQLQKQLPEVTESL